MLFWPGEILAVFSGRDGRGLLVEDEATTVDVVDDFLSCSVISWIVFILKDKEKKRERSDLRITVVLISTFNDKYNVI
jgi:hypothetical protein